MARRVGWRLFLVDGLFDLSYGPEDVVLLDGNLVHGVTGLRDLPGEGQASRCELERFSAILFSSFKRQGGMMAHGNYLFAGLPFFWVLDENVESTLKQRNF